MRPSRSLSSGVAEVAGVAGAALLFALCAGIAAAQSGPLQLKDRVLAVVDEDPILGSDLDRVIGLGGLGLAESKAGEPEREFRRRVLEDLISQRLRFHEIDRFGFQQVPVEEIERQVAQIRSRFKDAAAFNARLKELGLDLSALRQLVARQLEVLAYVDERLGPQVFVGFDDINAYYRNVLVPEMQRQRQPTPPLDEVREKIREVLKQQRLTQEIDRWTEELRRNARIAVYFDQPGGGPLPPVIKRYDRPGTPAAEPAVKPKPPTSKQQPAPAQKPPPQP